MDFCFQVTDAFGNTSTIDARLNGKTPRCDKHGKRVVPSVFKETFRTPKKVTLRPEQQVWFETIRKKLSTTGEGILELGTGSGKTILALALAESVPGNCVVLVDRQVLADQWKKTASEYDIDVQVLMIETAVSRDIVLDHSLVLFDEVHVCASPARHAYLTKFLQSKYAIGLSATLDRIDQRRPLIHCHFGQVIVSNISNHRKQETIVKVYRLKKKLKHYTVERYIAGIPKKIVDYAKMLEQVVKDNDRNEKVESVIKETLDSGDHVNLLVISDRIEQLQWFKEKFPDSTLVTSDNVKKLKKEHGKDLGTLFESSRLILGVTSIVSQAFNVVNLNALLFACPKKSITQSIGRIFRKQHENVPLIIDFVDNHPLFRKQFHKDRKGVYDSKIENVKYEFYES